MKILASSKTVKIINNLLKNDFDISYVYCIKEIDTRKRYIGKRTAKQRKFKDPRLDILNEYFTSSTDETFKENLIKNTKKFIAYILFVSDNYSIVDKKEKSLLKKYNAKDNNMFFNLHNGDGRYDTTNRVTVIDVFTGDSKTVDKLEYINDKNSSVRQYKNHNENTIVIFNKELEKYERIKLEEYHQNKSKYISHLTSNLYVYDKKANIYINL